MKTIGENEQLKHVSDKIEKIIYMKLKVTGICIIIKLSLN